jgi:hypothetical protein
VREQDVTAWRLARARIGAVNVLAKNGDMWTSDLRGGESRQGALHVLVLVRRVQCIALWQ